MKLCKNRKCEDCKKNAHRDYLPEDVSGNISKNECHFFHWLVNRGLKFDVDFRMQEEIENCPFVSNKKRLFGHECGSILAA